MPFLTSWDLPDPGIEATSPALVGGFFTTGAIWEAIFHYIYTYIYLDGKESACNAGDPGLMPVKGMALHSSILFWRIPWTKEPWTQGQWDTVDWVAESDMTERLCIYFIYIYTHTHTPHFLYLFIHKWTPRLLP